MLLAPWFFHARKTLFFRRKWTHQAAEIDIFVGDSRDRFFVVSGGVELLNSLGIVAVTAGLQSVDRGSYVLVHIDKDASFDIELVSPLPLPTRLKPFSSHGLNLSIVPGIYPKGSQPSAISSVRLTVASLPEPMKIGISGFMCSMDFSDLPIPSAASPSNGNFSCLPSWIRPSSRFQTLRMMLT